MPDAPPQPLLSYESWELTPEAKRVEDPLAKIKAYDDRLRQDLFARGLYDSEAEDRITRDSYEQAAARGLVDSPEQYTRPKAPDDQFVRRELFQGGPEGQARGSRFIEGREMVSEYDRGLLAKEAVLKRRLPFASYETPEGGLAVEVDPELGHLSDTEILEVAATVPGFDYRALPAVKDQLNRVPGSNYTKAQHRQAKIFEDALLEQVRQDDGTRIYLERAQESYNRGDMDEYGRNLDRLESNMNQAVDLGEGTARRLIDDLVKKSADPEDYDPQDPTRHVQYLSSGEVLLPVQTVLNEEVYKKTLDSLPDITPEQREAAEKMRRPRLEALAPTFVDAMGADPAAREFYLKEREAGKADADIVTEWFKEPGNYASARNRLRSTGMATRDAILGIPLSIFSLAGNEQARDTMIRMAEDRGRNERYANLFGDKYGVGQTIVDTAPQIVSDIIITRGIAAAARPGTSLLRKAVTPATRTLASSFVRAGEGSLNPVLQGLSNDVAADLGALAATSFTRSAGSQYVSVYSALSDDTDPDGSPKYTEEEKRRIALGAATISGLATAGLTAGFSALGAGGVEDLATGRLTAGALRNTFGLTDDAVAEGTRSAARAILGGTVSEASEEAIDQLASSMVQAYATDENFRLGPALKDALEAGIIGGVFGGAAGALESRVPPRNPAADAAEDAGLPETAAAVMDVDALALPFPVARNAGQPALPFPTAGEGGVMAPTETMLTPLEEGAAPVATGLAPTEVMLAPLEEGTAPVATGLAPTETMLAPVEEGAAPVATGLAPTETMLAPVEEGTAPAATGLAPTEVLLAPTEFESAGQELDLSEEIVDPNTYVQKQIPETGGLPPEQGIAIESEGTTEAEVGTPLGGGEGQAEGTPEELTLTDGPATDALRGGVFASSAHKTIFEQAARSGLVPETNQLRAALKETGFGGRRYAAEFGRRLRREVEARFPTARPPSDVIDRTIKSLTGQDVKVGGRLLRVPTTNSTTGVWTNDPVVTGHQLNAGLKVTATKMDQVNPRITVAANGAVTSVQMPDGQIVRGKGDWNRAGTAVAEFDSFRNSGEFLKAVYELPEAVLADSATIPGGPPITPQTSEAEVLEAFTGTIGNLVQAASPPDFSALDRDSIASAVQTAVLKDMREWSLATSEPAARDAAIAAIPGELLTILTPIPDRGGRPVSAYKAYLARRLDKVWRPLGRPVSPSAFVRQEIDSFVQGRKRRATVVSFMDTDTETGENKLDRAAARNNFAPDSIEIETLNRALAPEEAEGLRMLSPRIDAYPSETLRRLTNALQADPSLMSLFRRALVRSSAFVPGTPQALRAAASVRDMTPDELVLQVANTVFRNENVMSFIQTDRASRALKDALASYSYGVSQISDEEVEENRRANAAIASELGLDRGIRHAFDTVVRSPRYAKRYRAIAKALLGSGILDSLSVNLVDRPVEAYAGTFIPSSRTIVLNMAMTNSRGLLDVLSHEAIHAATVSAIDHPRTDKARALRVKLERLRATMEGVVPDHMRYAVSDLHEFVAHGLTDPAFQRLTQDTIYRNKSVWSRILESIATFLGFRVNPTFLDQLYAFTEEGLAHAALYGYPVVRAGAAADMALPPRPADPVAETEVPVSPYKDLEDWLSGDLLPAGFSYENVDEPGGRAMAWSARAKPGVIHINRPEMARITDGLDPANAKAFVRKIVKHEIAHHTVFSAMTDAEIREFAGGMPRYEIGAMAERYYRGAGYSKEEAVARIAEDLAAGTINEQVIVEEYLRAMLERATSGSTTEEDLAFHLNNPGLLSRILKYLGDVLKQLWAEIGGPDDIHTRTAVSRLAREHRRISSGYGLRTLRPFDTTDPSRDMRRMAMLAEEDPKASPAGAVVEQMEVAIYNTTEPFNKGTLWSRLFKHRSGDKRPARLAAERAFQNNALVNIIERQARNLEAARAAENPSLTVLQAAAGSTKPYITTDQEQFISTQYQNEVALAEVIEDLDERSVALKDAFENRKNNLMAARMENVAAARDARDAALEELERTAPRTREAVLALRDTIDRLSGLLASWMPEGDLKVIVGELGQGIYLTRTYNLHHKDGNPLEIFDNPELEPAVEAARKMFEDDFIDIRSAEIKEELLAEDRHISEQEARDLAAQEAIDLEIGQVQLENLLLRHGSKAFFQGASSFRIDLERYRRRTDVPEVLRAVLEEETDPVNNMVRTAFNVTYLATNTRFVHEQARLGKATGSLLTEKQFRGFKDLVRTTNREEFIASAVAQGWSEGTARTGYTEAAPGTWLPDWLLKAHAERNLLALQGYRKVAVSTSRYGAGELDGLYAEPTLADWFEQEFSTPPMARSADEKFVRAAGDVFAKATGASLGIATLGSAGFYTRNAVGNMFFLLQQGINPFSMRSVEAFEPAARIIRKDPDAYISKLTALGVVADDLRPETLKELFKRLSDQPTEGFVRKLAGTLAGKKGESLIDFATARAGDLANFASAIDSYGKIVAYETELDWLRRARAVTTDTPPSEEETRRMETEAADKVRRTFQARSMVPPVVESLTKSSFGRLLAPFLRFRADVFRIAAGTWSLAKEEMGSDNPVIRARGYRRRSGQVSAFVLSAAMAPLFNAIFSGIGDDEEEALRSALPPYLRSNSIFYSIDERKNVTSFDLTYVNPLAMLADPVARAGSAISRGEPGEVFEEGAAWVISMFLEDQIAAGALLEVRNNLDSDGKKIWLDTDDTVSKLGKQMAHFMESAYTPQSVKAAGRAVRAADRGIAESADFFETPIGHIVGHAMPVRPRAFAATDLADRSFRNLAQTQREVRMRTGRLKSRQILDRDDVADITGDWYDGIRAIYDDAATRIRGFEGIGLTKAQVFKSMTDSGFSRDRSRGLVFGGFAKAPVVSDALRRDIFEAGNRAAGNETGGEERLRMVMEELRARPRVIITAPPGEK